MKLTEEQKKIVEELVAKSVKSGDELDYKEFTVEAIKADPQLNESDSADVLREMFKQYSADIVVDPDELDEEAGDKKSEEALEKEFEEKKKELEEELENKLNEEDADSKTVKEEYKKKLETLEKEFEEKKAELNEASDDDEDEDEEDEKAKKKLEESISHILTEESGGKDFLKKAKAIVESVAAVQKERYRNLFEAKLEKEVEKERKFLRESTDKYLSHVAEEWLIENKEAVVSQERLAVFDSFMSGLRNLLEEHAIELPEEKKNAYDSLVESTDKLKEKLNTSFETISSLKKEIEDFKREKIVNESLNDLTEKTREKVESLIEDITFEDEETFRAKIKTLISIHEDSEDEDEDKTIRRKKNLRRLAEDFDLDDDERDEPLTPTQQSEALRQAALNTIKKRRGGNA